MKFGILISLVLGLSQFALAQVTDTLGYAEFSEGTPFLYQSPNGGYAFGTNGYNDVAKAQTYSHDNSFVLRQVLIGFGDVQFESQDSTSSVRVNVYDNNGFGITSLGQVDSIAPDSVLAFVDIPVYELLDDGSLTEADFTGSTLPIFGEFSVGLDFSNVANGDTVGLVSTTDGDAADTYNAWELTENGDWFTVEQPSYSWGLQVDFAIFPVIDENDPAGVSDESLIRFSLYPNPCSDWLKIRSETRETVTASIHDLSGKKIVDYSLGKENETLDLSGLESGVYLLSIYSETSTSTQRFIKQ